MKLEVTRGQCPQGAAGGAWGVTGMGPMAVSSARSGEDPVRDRSHPSQACRRSSRRVRGGLDSRFDESGSRCRRIEGPLPGLGEAEPGRRGTLAKRLAGLKESALRIIHAGTEG